MRRRKPARLTLASLACALTCSGWGWLCPLAAGEGVSRPKGVAIEHPLPVGRAGVSSSSCGARMRYSATLTGGIPSPLPQTASGVTPPVSAQQPKQLSFEERADIFMARKGYADAVDYYSRALRQSNQSNPVLWNKLGIAYQQQMNFNAARKAYKEAIRRRQDYPEAWNNLGTTYYLVNKFNKSIKYYRQAVTLNPSSASFHLNLGTSFYRMKKSKEAVDEYRQALTLDPNILNERSTMGTVVEARGADVEYYFYMGKVFASLGRVEEAVRYLRRAFEDGFQEFKKLDADPDFVKISQDPSYIALRTNPPVAIKE